MLNMAHAILITAYNNIRHIERIIKSFDENFNFYIHIDKKSNIQNLKYIYNTNKVSNVKIYSQFEVNWGGMRHVDAILFLCHKALEEKSNETFHLISGADYPIKNSSFFIDYFSSENSYMEYYKFPYSGWCGNGGLERIEFYHPLDRLNIKTKKDYDIYHRFLRYQINKGIKRAYPKIKLYGGSTWWSLKRELVKYIINNWNQNGLYDYLKNTFVPEELYISTLLLNSPFSSTIINNNLRYISWTYRNENMPANLDENDLLFISSNNYLFIRKVNTLVSEPLLKRIDNGKNLIKNFYFKEREEQDIVKIVHNIVIENIQNISEYSLMNGKLGAIIFLFQYAKKNNDTISYDIAYRCLIDIIDVNENLGNKDVIELGITLAYVTLNKLIIGDKNIEHLLDDFDSQVIELCTKTTQLNSDLRIVTYLLMRNKYNNPNINIMDSIVLNIVDRNEKILNNISQSLYNCYSLGLIGYSGLGILIIEKWKKGLYSDLLFAVNYI